jgi:hypothetical protein
VLDRNIGVSGKCVFPDILSQYKGTPYHDGRYLGGPQKVPGRVLCAYYDLGGEGVAYHDTDPKNHGSGELNLADGTYLNKFRIHEGVDTSYTKFDRKPDPFDDNPFDKTVLLETCLMLAGWNPENGSTSLSTQLGREPMLPIFFTPLIVAEQSLSK